jgi:D-alanyl-lipoteichoic acid acyltransferase DltB (MBOAT superfamily)
MDACLDRGGLQFAPVLFNTLAFGFFFTLVFAVYLALSRHRLAQNVLLLVASYFFYACWNWRFLGLLLLSTSVDWTLANLIAREGDRKRARRWVVTSVAVNLVFLGFFKYFNFFVDSGVALFGALGLPAFGRHLDIVLPVGISFYTFQSISYIVDVYRGEVPPAKNPVDFALFVAFFPHMVAGPIMPSRRLLPQMQEPRCVTWSEVQRGFHLVAWGLFKKVVIADNLALLVNPIFAREYGFRPGVVHAGVLAFAFQIYCDFSGYTDIARGLARMMGFQLMDNFDHPYLATCITDFWRRWHISLSTWLRDYVYVPLGGNRLGTARTYRNLILTMLLGGLWHGAAWTFVAWGAYQGFLLSCERALGGRRLILDPREAGLSRGQRLGWLLRVAVTFHLVGLGWIFFRAERWGQLVGMSTAYLDPAGWLFMPARLIGPVMLAILPVIVVDLAQFLTRDELIVLRIPAPLRGALYAAAALAFVTLGRFESNAFIYFQF